MASVPVSLLVEQGLMLKTLGRIMFSGLLPKSKRPANPSDIQAVTQILPPPSAHLLHHYCLWSGTSVAAYQQYIPAHLFSQFALPICSQQLEQLKYPISGVLNQGCGVNIIKPIPQGVPLHVTAEFIGVDEDNGRARVHQRLTIGYEGELRCLDVDFYTLFIVGKKTRTTVREEDSLCYERIGDWSVAANGGWEFALLTGDLNPIHWSSVIARFSPFKQKVLHGFGVFAKTFEVLRHYLYEKGQTLAHIDVRYVSPLALPSQHVGVWIAQDECVTDIKKDLSENTKEKTECYHLQLRSAEGKVIMIGSFQLAESLSEY